MGANIFDFLLGLHLFEWRLIFVLLYSYSVLNPLLSSSQSFMPFVSGVLITKWFWFLPFPVFFGAFKNHVVLFLRVVLINLFDAFCSRHPDVQPPSRCFRRRRRLCAQAVAAVSAAAVGAGAVPLFLSLTVLAPSQRWPQWLLRPSSRGSSSSAGKVQLFDLELEKNQVHKKEIIQMLVWISDIIGYKKGELIILRIAFKWN